MDNEEIRFYENKKYHASLIAIHICIRKVPRDKLK